MANPEEPLHCLQTLHGDEGSGKRRRRRRKEGEEKGASRKRKLSEEQASFLERSFGEERKLESGRKERLAGEAGLEPKQVAVWFQNRRARWRSKRVEEDYARLKAAHDAAVLDNRRLEAQILELKAQLTDALAEAAKLSCDGGGSPSASVSAEAHRRGSSASHDEQQHCAGIWEDYTWNFYGFEDMYPSPIFF